MPGVVKFITAADIPKGGINNFTPTSFGLAVEEVGSIGTCNSVIIFLSVGHLTKIASQIVWIKQFLFACRYLVQEMFHMLGKP